MGVQPAIPVRSKPSTAHWLWAVRIAAVASIGFVLGGLRAVGHSHGAFDLMLFFNPFWLLWYLSVVWDVRRKTAKKGLALAVGLGSAGFLILALWMTLVLSGDMVTGSDWPSLGFAGLLTLSQAVLGGSAIKAYYTMPREATDNRTLSYGLVVGGLLIIVPTFIAFLSLPGIRGSRIAVNHHLAVGTLRTINTAETTYSKTYQAGFSPSLAALGPPPPGTPPSASGAGLVDSVLSSGANSEYTFTYSAGPKDDAGHIKGYAVMARPMGKGAGTYSYFTDQSGVIRMTYEDRPATASDPPIAP